MTRSLAVAATLFGVTLPFLRRREEVLGAGLKLGAAFAAARVVERMHPEGTDQDDYHAAGVRIAERLRSGRVDGLVEIARTTPYDTRAPLVNTNAVRMLTGGVYALTGPDKQTGYVVFSWLGLCGQLLFVRAFEAGLPGADARRYARLVLFTPSLAFWTASIGKEALMTLGLGAASLGAARRDARLAAAGGALALLIRPHVLGVVEVLPTGQGRARFDPPSHPLAVVATVLFRPFPHEAGTAFGKAAAAEAAALLGLSLARARPPRRPYAVFAAAASAGLVWLLRGVANFGVLSRQRSPLLPFWFVLLAGDDR